MRVRIEVQKLSPISPGTDWDCYAVVIQGGVLWRFSSKTIADMLADNLEAILKVKLGVEVERGA